MDKLLAADVNDVIRLCEASFYDFIVVGSGIGGGILARTLIESGKQKRVLLIEQGSLAFSTHCLNTPRPHWNHGIFEGPSQDNDIVYRAVKETINIVTSASFDYVGGPVYCIGGRANVWGLFTPRMHETEAKKYFPDAVRSFLFDNGGYDEAYKLLANDPSASLDQPYPANGAVSTQAVSNMQQVIKDLDNGTGCSFTFCALAAEFLPRYPDQTLYQFSMGAFSTVNWILDRIYNKDERLTVLSRTQVLTVDSKTSTSLADSLTVRDSSGIERKIPVGKATVILSAGTIGSAAIALRSGINGNCGLVGKGLMDHDIWGTRFEVLQGKDAAALHNQPLRLQSWVRFSPDADYVLLNITVNANTFLGQTQEERFPTVYLSETLDPMSKIAFQGAIAQGMGKSTIQVVFEFCATLKDENKVLNLPEPTTTIEIQHLDDNTGYLPQMQRLSQTIGTVLAAHILGLPKGFPPTDPVERTQPDTMPEKQRMPDRAKQPPVGQRCCSRPGPCCSNVADLELCPCTRARDLRCPCSTGPPTQRLEPCVPLPTLAKAGFGAVAHEVGTMRMGEESSSVVDENLRVRGVDNLYACDLSVFPVSPAANPTLTLAALAQRLGFHLLK